MAESVIKDSRPYIVKSFQRKNITAIADDVTDIFIPASLSGYSLIGVVGTSIGSGVKYISLVSSRPSADTQVFVRMLNRGNQAVTGIDVIVFCLFAKL